MAEIPTASPAASPASGDPTAPARGGAKRPAWAWVPSLYFAEGVPYMVVAVLSVLLYKRLGLSNTEIALFTSWLYLPWVIKPFWSPLVEMIKTKRLWIIAMQVLIGGGLAGVALTFPTTGWVQATLASSGSSRSRRRRTTSPLTGSTCSRSTSTTRRGRSAGGAPRTARPSSPCWASSRCSRAASKPPPGSARRRGGRGRAGGLWGGTPRLAALPLALSDRTAADGATREDLEVVASAKAVEIPLASARPTR